MIKLELNVGNLALVGDRDNLIRVSAVLAIGGRCGPPELLANSEVAAHELHLRHLPRIDGPDRLLYLQTAEYIKQDIGAKMGWMV